MKHERKKTLILKSFDVNRCNPLCSGLPVFELEMGHVRSVQCTVVGCDVSCLVRVTFVFLFSLQIVYRLKT